MTHKIIQINDLDLCFSHKVCFENFNCQIHNGSRIAIIGRNGSGKSTLLKMIASLCDEAATVGYVPQVIMDHTDLSGGQRLNKAITNALSHDPDILLLDEPTNHLDSKNRKSLIHMLQKYSGTLIMVSHDQEVLRHCTNILWHIDNGKIHIFSGNYDDYMREIKLKRASIAGELEILNRQKKDMHYKLMQEQGRAAKSKANGEKNKHQKKWPKVISNAKVGGAEETYGRKKSAIDKYKSDLSEKLQKLRPPEIIIPKFTFDNADAGRGMVVQISAGSIGYLKEQPILSEISLSLMSGERIAIIGDNGSGKSTLMSGILNKAGFSNEALMQSGNWSVIKGKDIGYLDQHYSHLNPDKTPLESIAEFMPFSSYVEIRRHLNDFLFRKNEEVTALVKTLSGGEKARLSLAQIAAKTPKFLMLDEITNNLDLETKVHVAGVLRAYPGAMIVISHDADFINEIGISEVIDVQRFKKY